MDDLDKKYGVKVGKPPKKPKPGPVPQFDSGGTPPPPPPPPPPSPPDVGGG